MRGPAFSFHRTGNPNIQRRLCPQCGMQECRADECYCSECDHKPEPVYHTLAVYPNFWPAGKEFEIKRVKDYSRYMIDKLWANAAEEVEDA